MAERPLMQPTNPYTILHLDPWAPRELIEEAYWLLVRMASSGVQDAESRTRIVNLNAAYELLMGPQSAAVSDAARAAASRAPQTRSFYHLLGIDALAEAPLVDLAFGVMARRLGSGEESREGRAVLERARSILADRQTRRLYDASPRTFEDQDARAPGAAPSVAARPKRASSGAARSKKPVAAEAAPGSMEERTVRVDRKSRELVDLADTMLRKKANRPARKGRATPTEPRPAATSETGEERGGTAEPAPVARKPGASPKNGLHDPAARADSSTPRTRRKKAAPGNGRVEPSPTSDTDPPAPSVQGNGTTLFHGSGTTLVHENGATPVHEAAAPPGHENGAVPVHEHGAPPVHENGTAPVPAAPPERKRRAPTSGSGRNGHAPAKRATRRRIAPPVAKPEERVVDDPQELLRDADLTASRGFARGDLALNYILPLSHAEGRLRVAVATPEAAGIVARLASHMSYAVDIVYATPRAIRDAMLVHFRPVDEYAVSYDHSDRHPDLSARQVITARQVLIGGALAVVFFGALIAAPIPALIALVALATGMYTVSIAFKLLLVGRALSSPREALTPDADIANIDEDALPTYSILLPVYHEGAILNDLIESIDRIDYPKSKLDVKLLIEPDDLETQAIAAQIEIPAHFQILLVPADGPKGKPKACNYGLLHAHGEFCVLYDAEDMPDPLQLKKALVAFARGGWRVSCVQAKLNYYNPNQNLLTRWFTMEYATWFDLYLPGLNSIGAPITLGGTSNHFRTQVLRRVGGWDPFNVTEDADLGIRFSRHGLITTVIDSVTLEEANSRLGNWMRQRSRWIKGYMQTWLVHMRQPVKMWRELGAVGFISFQAFVLGTFFAYFANPIFWGLVGLWYATHAGIIQTLFPTPVMYLATTALFAGNFMFVLASMAGCLRRGFFEGVKFALLSPVYWLLMSVAAWKALYQLIWKTHYWEKTDHGLVP